MVSADVKRKIKDRMRWELVLKSTTAAPTIATLVAGIGYLQL